MPDRVSEKNNNTDLKIAILTRADFRSPRILADSIKIQLIQQGVEVEIFHSIDVLKRLVSYRASKLNYHFWLKRKLKHIVYDLKLIKKLRQFDVVIISECIPNGFLSSLYNVEKIKKIIRKPVGIYEVYYLGNAPTQIDRLQKNNDALLSRFDFHLSVSDITEIKKTKTNNWFGIGIKAESWKLKPLAKKEVIAIVDFAFPGNEQIRQMQINVLRKLDIKYISLECEYSIEEIRRIYQKGTIYFMQSYEAFGLPILECLCSGCQIFTPQSWWPMSWRLNENPKIHGEGILPECFTVYNGEEDLINKLLEFKRSYDLDETPKKVFDNFLKHYRDFYFGNEFEIDRFLKRFQNFA